MTAPRVNRLRELRLHGFKTFAEPTRFVFEPGVNAVIGPNGSGKSNMADGVRWVLGEQSNRSLRTRRADDVIFAGSQQRKPTGMAEVLLTLDNSEGWLPIDFAEVTIGRRAYRSGEGEYLLNGARTRLREIIDLLAGGQLGASSLVVVGQGTVDAALSLRPDERRQLFEEAAGVKTLQVRKNESLARLARAEENLTRVADLLGELKPQVRRLALQAQHQEEHDALQHRGRALVLESARRREGEIRERLGDARRRSAAAEAAAEALRIELASGRELLAAAETAYWAAEEGARAAGERREETREVRIRLESRVESSRARIAELRAGLEAATRDRGAVEGELRSLPADEAVDGAEALRASAREAEAAWHAALDATSAADTALLEAETGLAEARRHEAAGLAAAAERAERAERRRRRIVHWGEELEIARAARIAADAARLEAMEAAALASSALDSAQAALAVASREADPLQAGALDARRRTTLLAEQLANAQAQLEALGGGDGAGSQRRLGARLAATGWKALVDAIEPPEDAWPAIEAAVGGEIGDALLWRDADPTRAAQEARGTARFLGGRRAPDATERERALAAVGARRTLDEWIGERGSAAPASAGREGGLPGLFARVAVADDLDALLRGWQALPAGWCAVTPDGDLADARGILAVRGRADPPGGAAARRAARRHELAGTVAALEAEHDAAAEVAARAVAAAAAGQRRLGELRRAVEIAEDEAARASASARDAALAGDRATAEEERLEQALAAEGEETDAPLPADGAGSEHGALMDQVVAAREAALGAARERDAARQAWVAARSALDAAERSLSTGRSRRVSLEARLEQLAASQEAARATLEGLDAAHAQELAAVDDARQADEAAGAARQEAEVARDAARADLLRLEREGSGAAGRLSDLDRAVQAAALDVLRAEEALNALAHERALELEALTVDADDGEAGAAPAASPELTAELAALDLDALEGERRRVRRTLAQIGSVNPFAVEEHREQSARLDELSAQEHDLSAAIASTRELISRLESEIEERFGAAFAAISERFDEFCRLLFAGGSAALERVEGDGEEAGGIEIVVRPPGKRPQRLAMLSGGERALTGVALLFAMLSVNPVPFCILDEVDAALDEANIGRFAEALRKLAEEIDFVVITHNRATIEVADTIYGVTMSDAAVSRVISLRLADVPIEVTA